MSSLTEIANRNFTDKGTLAYEAHGYTDEYDKYIPSKGKFTLIEVGIWHGDSLRMWEEYNPELDVYGLDIDVAALMHQRQGYNAKWLIGNATSPDFINKVIEQSGPPDFVIDDGSHVYKDILDTFEALFPKLKSGGYYFIEDLHAGYAKRDRLLETLGINSSFKDTYELK